MNFEQFSLDPRIVAGVKAAGYTTPTPIQQQSIPTVMEGSRCLGAGANRHRRDRGIYAAHSQPSYHR